MPVTAVSELRDDPAWLKEMLPIYQESCEASTGKYSKVASSYIERMFVSDHFMLCYAMPCCAICMTILMITIAIFNAIACVMMRIYRLSRARLEYSHLHVPGLAWSVEGGMGGSKGAGQRCLRLSRRQRPLDDQHSMVHRHQTLSGRVEDEHLD